MFDTVRDHDWSQNLAIDASFPVTGRSRLSGLTSVPAIQRSVKRAIVESLKREYATDQLTEQGCLQKVDVAILKDVATITMDTTGPSLHKRGYRKLAGAAPLKETLAAALIDLSVWNPQRMLVDPFCGTGTIPIEAALIGRNIAPGLKRDFSFDQWPMVTPRVLEEARQQAQEASFPDRELQITGTDCDEAALEMARYHARQAGVADTIHFQKKSFEEFRSKRTFGCVVTNPPYGERLEDTRKLLPLYRSIPMVMQRVPTWSLFVLTNMPGFQGIVQKSATRRRKLFNGRHECTYYQYLGPRPPRPGESVKEPGPTNDEETSPSDEDQATPAAATVAEPVFGGLQPVDHRQAELFRNRLTKRARHLRRWPTRRGITCFRLYERDIPEIPLVVDRYGDALHMTQYERPHERDLARDAAWLDLMKKTAAATLDIPIGRVYAKQRRRDQPYEKVDSRGKLTEVTECGLKFLVNLDDYVDTGLFLDHRNLRQIVRDEAADRDFLNLFAYTGSFSVYAAAGKARSTTTVDLSGNYLKWAEQNMQLNEFTGSAHQFVANDSMTFLKQIIASPQPRFDLAVVDPPTYSNSKRAHVADWDVQKHHVTLLTTCSPGHASGQHGLLFVQLSKVSFRRGSLA